MADFKFEVAEEMLKAWNWCWTYYCEPSTSEFGTYPPRQQWLTATDLERRVRAAAAEVIEGRVYGSMGPDNSYGDRHRFNLPKGYRLMDVVRDWLLCQVTGGVLVAHNFGRAHCSGMRFRPSGITLTEGEKKTLAAKERKRKQRLAKGGS